MTLLYATLFFLLVVALAVGFSPLYHRQEEEGKKRALLLLCLFFTFASFGLYQLFGTPQIVPMLAQRDEKLKELRTSILSSSALVKQDSKNLGAWVELGQDFIETGQFAAASNAFRHAVLLSEGNPRLILAYAKSLIMEADGKVTDDAKKALQMVLLQDKENPDARYFMALRNLQDGKMPEAMAEMKSLYRSLPDDSPLKSMINKQIGRD